MPPRDVILYHDPTRPLICDTGTFTFIANDSTIFPEDMDKAAFIETDFDAL
jgi:hypothetical protein